MAGDLILFWDHLVLYTLRSLFSISQSLKMGAPCSTSNTVCSQEPAERIGKRTKLKKKCPTQIQSPENLQKISPSSYIYINNKNSEKYFGESCYFISEGNSKNSVKFCKILGGNTKAATKYKLIGINTRGNTLISLCMPYEYSYISSKIQSN